MKDTVKKLEEIACRFSVLAGGVWSDFMNDEVYISYTSECELHFSCFNLIDIWFWSTPEKKTAIEIKDISRIDEIPSIIDKLESFLNENK